MGSNVDRKKAIREYKERKIPRGVFAVRCTATGQAWVDSTPDLRAAQNSVFFMLRTGSNRNPALLAEWNTHGEQAFQFEILETLDDDVLPMAMRDLLKEKKSHWMGQLNAKPLMP